MSVTLLLLSGQHDPLSWSISEAWYTIMYKKDEIAQQSIAVFFSVFARWIVFMHGLLLNLRECHGGPFN